MTRLPIIAFAIAALWVSSARAANQVPAQLSDPDGKAGDPTKPVQVYILAGQSNMAGMGDLSGAKNLYSGIYLSSDPAVPKGPLAIYQAGNSFKSSGFPGGPPRFWMQQMDLLGNGDLEAVAKREGKFPWLVDDKGEWTVRNDVWFQEARIAENAKGSPLSAAPFGQLDGMREALNDTCTAPFCGCAEKPKTLWEKEVLLLRQTFDLPPLKGGHRYRLVVGGAAHVNSGEGFAIYVNGKLLGESTVGVSSRQGGQPRGAPIYADIRGEFEGGKVTIAGTSFLRYNSRQGIIPPRGHFSLWMEEQKIPPLKEVVAGQ